MYLPVKFFLSLIVIIKLFDEVTADSRRISPYLNPDCNDDICRNPDKKGSYYNLLYVKATGTKDLLHFLYSSIGSFTIMAFRTDLKVNLNVNWTNLLSDNDTLIQNSISFSQKPLEMVGYTFPTLFEFDDENGVADMTKIPNNSSFWYQHNTKDLIWDSFDETISYGLGIFKGRVPGQNGSVKITIKYPGQDTRDTDLPHLLLNPNSCSIDFEIDSFVTNFNFSKFGLNILFLTDSNNVYLSSNHTLDDEYTPGTFKQWNVKIMNDKNDTTHSFLQWKPIFYYYDERTLENSTITRQYDLDLNQTFQDGIGKVFFDSSKLFVKGMNISFGLEGKGSDGYFYSPTNYSVWTFSIGMGSPPIEKMSFIVTLVIIIGFGLPALVILAGLIVMVIRKIKNSHTSQFNEL